VTVALKEATAEETAKALGEALGTTVTSVPPGSMAPKVTLDLVDVPPLEALDRVAAALRGRWQSVYQLTAERGSGPRFATGRRVSLSLQDAGPATALATIATADGGILAASPPESPSITISLHDFPVEDAMDRVTARLGCAWVRTFQILPGAEAVTTTSEGRPQPEAATATPTAVATPPVLDLPPPPVQPLVALTEPAAVPEPGLERGPTARRPDLGRALSDGLVRLMQSEPQQRGAAIRQFAEQVQRGLSGVDALPPAERAQHRRQIARVYQSGMRIYRGLTADQQREFRPLFDVLRRWLNP
jgi:hypothetical protein